MCLGAACRKYHFFQRLCVDNRDLGKVLPLEALLYFLNGVVHRQHQLGRIKSFLCQSWRTNGGPRLHAQPPPTLQGLHKLSCCYEWETKQCPIIAVETWVHTIPWRKKRRRKVIGTAFLLSKKRGEGRQCRRVLNFWFKFSFWYTTEVQKLTEENSLKVLR